MFTFWEKKTHEHLHLGWHFVNFGSYPRNESFKKEVKTLLIVSFQ